MRVAKYFVVVHAPSHFQQATFNNRHGFVEISATVIHSQFKLRAPQTKMGRDVNTYGRLRLTGSVARSVDSVSLPTLGTDGQRLVREKGFQ
jgi:hypothetical protein